MTSTVNKQIIICVGAGGVGKTTVASVLGLHHALAGKRTLVITVDPARRLLDAMSLEGASSKPKKVALSSLTDKAGHKDGALFAFMPDLKKEWMDFLESCIDRADMRHEIASNHFYRYMADGLPGAFEIICSHVLFRLMNSEQFDTIILDTPPSSHSVSFFDVPGKISSVLEQGVFRKLLSKRNAFLLKITKKLAFFSGGIIEGTLERLVGSHFFSELIDFALTIDALYDPMLERARAMDRLLKAKNTEYVLVVRPTLASVNDSVSLQESLKKRGITINQIIMNQVTPDIDDTAISLELDAVQKVLPQADMVDALHEMIDLYRQEVSAEKNLFGRVKKNFVQASMQTLKLSHPSSIKSSIISDLINDYEQQVL